MKGFQFEKNLLHQTRAVESVMEVFRGGILREPAGPYAPYINPEFLYHEGTWYPDNIRKVQERNGIPVHVKRDSNILDIQMETGTGKTYTYTKTMFELNREFGIFKFIIVVPTLSIKAGTINFLRSESARLHFKELYGKTIRLHVVESQKSSKTKKSRFPVAVSEFVRASRFEKDRIQVLLINAGMINSDTMARAFDTTLLDRFSVPFEALASTKSFMIIDEPHRFAKENKTWANIQKMQPQFIIRYGATFKQYENLIYVLTAVDAFRQNLVKGVIGHITEFNQGQQAMVKLVNTDGKEATFQLTENGQRRTVKLTKGESLQRVHPKMENLFIEKMNKSVVVLSNGLELHKGDKLNPYSYDKTLQEMMVRQAIRNHFETERELLTKDPKIKPLTLFFIDNIDTYREKDGYLRQLVEAEIRSQAEALLQKETDPFYREYLQKTLEQIHLTHGGYFSKDNTGKDEAVEKEINEILHDKEALLDLNNPRRFIFSKWTLREGWDNPNVFQICKLRSSGSEISKLQEVGRGLRLPVNEYGSRVKDEQFYLHYFVDFTETDFVEKLRNEVNEKSGILVTDKIPEKLSEEMARKICNIYRLDEDDLMEKLVEEGIIRVSHKFKEGGFERLREMYPEAFEKGVGPDKIRKAGDRRNTVKIRRGLYPELKELWEKINQKVILEYKFDDEDHYRRLFVEFLKDKQDILFDDEIQLITEKLEIEGDQAQVRESRAVYHSTPSVTVRLKYSDFLKKLGALLPMNIKSLHLAFVESGLDINPFLTASGIRRMKQYFDEYVLMNAMSKFGISYEVVSHVIHPTKLTHPDGSPRSEIPASDIGSKHDEEAVAPSYLFEELYYDSDLEKQNIKTRVEEVIVFTKIPKNSIKIPVSGGKSYSPDFAYVIKQRDGKKRLYFVVETKDSDESQLRGEELAKIRHAEKLFGDTFKITFKTQMRNRDIIQLIEGILNNNS